MITVLICWVYLKLTRMCRCWRVFQAHIRWWRARFCGHLQHLSGTKVLEIVWNTKQMLHVSSVTEMSEVFSIKPAGTNSCREVFGFFCHVLSIRLSLLLRLPDKDDKHALALQPSTLHLRRDGAFLNSCGDFVTQSCCRGNMSHLRQTWVGSHLEFNCVFPSGRERQTFHWPPSWHMFLGFKILEF